MDADQIRSFLLTLPHVVETMQWGDNLVFWVGDKAIGGKMFALIDLDGKGKYVASFTAGAERFAELVEIEGLYPAPYFARIFWIAAERWSVFRGSEWQVELRAAHARTLANLSPRTRANLELPPSEQKRLIAKRKTLLASRKP